jgi:hypothetical protein
VLNKHIKNASVIDPLNKKSRTIPNPKFGKKNRPYRGMILARTWAVYDPHGPHLKDILKYANGAKAGGGRDEVCGTGREKCQNGGE